MSNVFIGVYIYKKLQVQMKAIFMGSKNWKLWQTIFFVACLVCTEFLVHACTTKVNKHVPRTAVGNTFFRNHEPMRVPEMSLCCL